MIIDCEPVSHVPSGRKIALLSGLSDPESCALSEVQQQFFRQLAVVDSEAVRSNFPYLLSDAVPKLPPSLLRASWANGRQFLQAASDRYRWAATRHWDALVQSCDELTVITLSCGLEILNACLVAGRRPKSLRVIALGPVAWSRPPVAHTLIQGTRDYVSRPFFRTAEIRLPGVGHLNYLDHPPTIDAVNQLLRQDA